MIGLETLDRSDAPGDLVRATLADIELSNALFGGRHAVLTAVDQYFRDAPAGSVWTLLDLGTGAGDVATAVRRRARRHGLELRLIGVEHHRVCATVAAEAGVTSVVADVAALPFAPQSVDIIVMSQFLHHFPRERVAEMVQTAGRLARRAVVVADLRRTWLAACGIWLVSFPLRFHPVSRHDGVLSVRRGFTRRELANLLTRAGVQTTVHTRPGFRLTATWVPHRT